MNTTDIVHRLRDTSGRHINGLYDREAADEIERLRAAAQAALDVLPHASTFIVKKARDRAPAAIASLRAALRLTP